MNTDTPGMPNETVTPVMPELAEILDELNRAHRTADVIIERFTS
jgi:hypothetical protein